MDGRDGGSEGDGHAGEDQLVQHLYSLRVADFAGGKPTEKRAPADGGDEVLGEIGSHLRKAWLGHVYRGDSEKISKHEEEEDTKIRMLKQRWFPAFSSQSCCLLFKG